MTSDNKPDPNTSEAAPDYDAMAKQLLDDWQSRWKSSQLPDQLRQIQTQWQQMIQPALEIGQNFWQHVMNPVEPDATAPATTEEDKSAHDDTAVPAAAEFAEPVQPVPAAAANAAHATDLPDAAPIVRPTPAAPAAAAPAAGADLRAPVAGNAAAGSGPAINTELGTELATELARRMDGLSARILRLEAELERLRRQQQRTDS